MYVLLSTHWKVLTLSVAHRAGSQDLPVLPVTDASSWKYITVSTWLWGNYFCVSYISV